MTETLRKNQTLVITMSVLVVVYLLALRGLGARDGVVTTLRGLSSGSVLFLAASGLSLIFGLMDVLNLAHGAFFMIGAYVAWSAFVRPDTFVDLITPLALLAAGFVLMPLWQQLVGRLRLSARAARAWPWIGLAVSGILLLIIIPRTPIALWDAKVYDDSPIIWTQHFDSGQTLAMLEPAQYTETPPALGLMGLFLGSCLAALSVAGLGRRYGVAGTRTLERALQVSSRTLVVFVLLIVVSVGAYLANDAITEALLGLDTTWLFVIAILVAVLTGAFFGGLMEATLIRPLYARPLYQLMLTLGLGVVGIEIVRAVWGRTGFTMPRPSLFAGAGTGCPATTVGDWFRYRCSTFALSFGDSVTRIRVYNEIFLILAGLAVLIFVWLLLQRTRLGMIIRAGVQDSEMVEALGINVRRIFTLVFALGTGLAALGGVLSGPSTGLSDAMAANLLLGALVALAIGGLTSFPGAALGAVIVGLLQQFIIKYGQLGISLPFSSEPFKPTPTLVPASTVLLMVIILLLMPQGLLGRKE